eukprot:CAMPEP_0184008256 /NCGR_PEP_ID=MMETSP0954-20121128/1861_1 /TAXON_ID=627963 /ORGANISM="Aplanochytrium sp, Strain PBS07" /LENGTH=39 /DNA_ID= /DNA_START= /DNA_END= /DNA_ORIENTATION=
MTKELFRRNWTSTSFPDSVFYEQLLQNFRIFLEISPIWA